MDNSDCRVAHKPHRAPIRWILAVKFHTKRRGTLRERLRNSKNIILLLSSITTNSRALREEIDYGINDQGLPVIVVYPEYATKESLLVGGSLKQAVKNLWGNLPVFRDSMSKIPTLHVPMNKELIKKSLQDGEFVVGSMKAPGIYRYNP